MLASIDTRMKRNEIGVLAAILTGMLATSCLFKDYPVDEDGLIITDRSECAVLKFDVLDTRDVSALYDDLAKIDTVAQTITAKVKYKADMTCLWPVFTLSTDCKLEPKVRQRYDFTEPMTFTVISGNRKIRKTYTITLERANP